VGIVGTRPCIVLFTLPPATACCMQLACCSRWISPVLLWLQQHEQMARSVTLHVLKHAPDTDTGYSARAKGHFALHWAEKQSRKKKRCPVMRDTELRRARQPK